MDNTSTCDHCVSLRALYGTVMHLCGVCTPEGGPVTLLLSLLQGVSIPEGAFVILLLP